MKTLAFPLFKRSLLTSQGPLFQNYFPQISLQFYLFSLTNMELV